MKKVLIISPHFPPMNTADMHRVRHMLSYINEFGWQAEIITVDPKYIESYSVDPFLSKTIPKNTIIHFVKAFETKYTRKIGLGSLSMRSYFFFLKKGNYLIKQKKIDLVFFSTTAFHVMALGPYWKRKFNIPFVLDIQDPWRSDFYLDKPRNERPPKFRISYAIDKYLERKTIPFADGIISVSDSYIEVFQKRYKNLKSYCKVIPFAGFEKDFEFLDEVTIPIDLIFSQEFINIVYVGRGGYDMRTSLECYFQAKKQLINQNPEKFKNLRTYFIGTSYAPKGKGISTILPIAKTMGLSDSVVEITDRQEYFVTLKLLKSANILFVPGSSDSSYTASKIYPYILAEKPLLACFHEESSVVNILKLHTNSSVITFNNIDGIATVHIDKMREALNSLILKPNNYEQYDKKGFKPYLAETMTKNVINLFNKVIEH